jgi:hypothetical protein
MVAIVGGEWADSCGGMVLIILSKFSFVNMGPLPLDELVVMVASFVMPIELIEEAVLYHHAPHPSCSYAIRRPGFCRAAIPSSDRPAVREASGPR